MACANDFMFSQASVVVVGPAFLLWFLIGLLLVTSKIKIQFLGIGAAIVFLTIIPLGHPEIALCFWMIYLALVTVRIAFQRKRDTVRRVNLIYHGSFLGLIIVGGMIAKAFYWSSNGGFAGWIVQMRDTYFGFLIFFGIVAFIALGWIAIRQEWRKLPKE